MKLNANGAGTPGVDAGSRLNTLNSFYVGVDTDTKTALSTTQGFLDGVELSTLPIRIDQGLDTTEIPPFFNIDADLNETQYIIEIDNRLGRIYSKSNQQATLSFIDDDNIASYFVTSADFITPIGVPPAGTQTTALQTNHVIQGPRGTALLFKIQGSLELNSSTFLFNTLGSTTTVGSTSCYYIDTNVRVRGATTGFTLDVPVRFLKKV